MEIVLQTKELKKSFKTGEIDRLVLKGIEMSVNEGEFVGIMGPSGSGKTTLLQMLSTIDEPSSGEIFYGDQDITKLSEDEQAHFRGSKLGFIFQDFNLLDVLTLHENIALALSLTVDPPQDIEERILTIADRLGIRHVLTKYPYEVSGGEKQRCAAARALVHNPSLVFADEPTGALDSYSSTQLLELLEKLHSEDQATILMVTHDAFSASYADRILFLKDGEIHNELFKQRKSKDEFFQEILSVLADLRGATSDQ